MRVPWQPLGPYTPPNKNKGRKIRREQRRTTGKHQFLLYYRELEAHRVFLLFHHIMNYHNTILISTTTTTTTKKNYYIIIFFTLLPVLNTCININNNIMKKTNYYNYIMF